MSSGHSTDTDDDPRTAVNTPVPGALPSSSLARRIHGWSWQAFPIGMGTGAVYVVLSQLKWKPEWMLHIEVFFFFLNIALFLLNCSTLLLQLILFPRQSKRLLFDPVKGIFVPLIVLSFATILIGTINYAIPSGHVPRTLIYDLFWIYVVFSLIVCFPMLMIWFNKPHDVNTFTPAWAFLVFPLMLVGVVAFNVLRVIDPSDNRAIGVLLVGYVFQGLGFGMTCFYLCIYILRIMTTGFLEGHQANGAFVACGPPGFTALALINLGQSAREIFPKHDLISPIAGEVFYACSVLCALMLFGLAIFFFFFGILPYWFKVHKNLSEILGCWALTFPNVGWIGTLRALGDIFHIEAFFDIHAILAAIMFLTWIVLFGLTALAFFKGEIFFTKNDDVWNDSEIGGSGAHNTKVKDSHHNRGNSQDLGHEEKPGRHQGMNLAAEILAPGFRASMAPSTTQGSHWNSSSCAQREVEARSGWDP